MSERNLIKFLLESSFEFLDLVQVGREACINEKLYQNHPKSTGARSR